MDALRKYMRSRKRNQPVLDVDLNGPPPCESHEETSNCTRSQDRQGGPQSARLPAPIVLDGGARVPAPIVLDDDDDVIICDDVAPRAKDNRNRGHTHVIDLDSEDRSSRGKRRRVSTGRIVINCDVLINVEDNSNVTRKTTPSVPLPPPPPKEPTFTCPICMGTLVEETSTKCGHIFCKACIKKAIAAQTKCPTCRKRTTMKDIIKIYLPVANYN